MLNDHFFELASNSPKFRDDQTATTTTSKVENVMPPQFMKEKNRKWFEGL